MRKGFSLVEAAIVLGVVGLIIGGIWIAAAAVQKQNKIKQVTSGIVIINNNIRRLYYGQSANVYVRFEVDVRLIPMVTQGAEGYGIMPNGLFAIDSFMEAPLQDRQNVRLDNGLIVHDLNFLSVDSCIRVISAIAAGGRADLNEINVGPTRYTTFPIIPTAAECAVGNPVNVWFKF